MFTKFATVVLATLAVFAAATPTPGGGSTTCNSGTVQCCNVVQDAGSVTAGQLGGLGLLSLVDITALNSLVGNVGLGCTPVTVIGSGVSCSQQTACCSGTQFNGLVNVGCNNIDVL